ncbi:MAG: VOC family protein [Proteobacteria bacterium]|nr:VOC family protein [Pseudomonadota bacterium]MBW3618183.1 VOC family protein [Pseudomonadota bacterium]
MKVKGLSWVGVGSDDFPRTLAFFTEVLGLEPAVVDERGVALLHAGEGQVVEIFGPGTGGRALTSPPAVAFEVDDVRAARAELARYGVEIIGDIGAWNGFEWLYFRSPDGYVFSVKKTPPPGWEKTA